MISRLAKLITTIYKGSASISRMSVGSTQVWPHSGTYILTDPPFILTNRYSSSGSFTISASGAAWIVSSNSSWATISKESSTKANYSIQANNTGVERTATFSFMLNNQVQASVTVTQSAS